MHHPSWLFPGACSSNPHRQDSTFHDIPANGNNKNSGATGFEISSFVRSLNRNGIQLPESLIPKSTGLAEENNNNKCDKRADDKVRKSINDFLSILNESVDHVVGIPSRDRSNSSSFESFRSVREDRDAAAWNELIQLVSTTAHEFRDITRTGNPTNGTECDCSGGSAGTANSGQRRPLEPNHSRWRGEKFRHDQDELGRTPRSNSKSWRDYGKDCGNFKSSGGTTTGKIELDVTPTNDDSRTPEVVQNYSEICGPDAKRGEDCLREIGNFDTPRRLVNEILGRNSRDREPPVWVTCNRRINLEDSLWPAGFTITSNGDFPPYFTGGPNKAFNFRSKIDVNSKRFMNVSRSSPIFVDAGEAMAEPPSETFARDHEMADRFSVHPDEGHPIDCRPTKLDKTVASLENAESQSSRSYKQPVDIETKPSSRVSKEKKKASESYRNEQPDTKRSRGRAKLVVKRGRKIRKQFSKRNNQEVVSETEEELSDQDSKSIDKSPRSPMQRFFEESCQARKEDETIGSARSEDFVESRMRTVSTIRSPANNHFVRKQVRPMAKPSTKDRCNRCNHVIAADRSKKDFLRIIDRPSSTSSRNAVTPKWLNIKCVCDKPGRKPDHNVRVTSSPSIPGNLEQSRVPQPPERIAIGGPAKSHGVPTVSSARLQNSSTRGAFETRRLQRPSTANETSLNRVPEAQTQGRSLKPVNSRGSSKDRKKSVNADRTTGVNRETTIPVLRSKTFVHQIRRESSVRCTAVKKDCPTPVGERASSKCMLNSATSGPMKQLYRKPWKNLSRAQRDADLSSETNLDDTPTDSRVNTDIELSRSVSAVSNCVNSKKLSCRVEFKSKDSMIRAKEPDTVVNANNESRMAKNTFQNKHARSLRMLKSILSHQGVNVEGVNKEAKEIRSRISNEPGKKSQVPICTGRKRSSPLAESENNSPKTSRTLFEKLAILAEAQPEKLARSVITKDSSERCSSFMNVGNDSMTSCAKSTKDAADQCSMDYASTVSINSKNDPQVRGSSIDGHPTAMCVDASVSPLPSMTDLSRMESTKSFEVAATQTHCEVVDKDSLTDKRYNPVMNVCTETERATHEVSIDCSKASKDIGCGKDFSDVQSISREVNTETPEVFVKSRGVCFRGARKVDGSSQAIPAAQNCRDSASGRDYIEPPGVSELVNTDRQHYLYVDRSVDVLGPKTTEDACQFEPPLAIVDVAVGDCYARPSKLSSGFSRITISKDLLVSSPTSFTNFDLPEHNYAASGASTSSLVPWRGNSAEQFSNSISHVPKEAITALGMVLERSKNLYKAMEIHRENLAARKIELGQELSQEFCRTVGETKETNEELNNHPGLQVEIADIMSDLLSDATGKVLDQENVSWDPLDQEQNLMKKNPGNPKIIEILDDVSETGEEICQPSQKSWNFSLLSRNSLLTVVYGTVCSFVFWALQFSITCDSP